MYIKIVDPTYTYTNFTLEEQDKILKAKRSNNTLVSDKLVNSVPECEINEIHVAMEKCFTRMKQNLIDSGVYPSGLPRTKLTA